jgi:hypothetical protein
MKRVYEGACTIDLISLPYQHGGVNVYLLENRDRLTLIDAWSVPLKTWTCWPGR